MTTFPSLLLLLLVLILVSSAWSTPSYVHSYTSPVTTTSEVPFPRVYTAIVTTTTTTATQPPGLVENSNNSSTTMTMDTADTTKNATTATVHFTAEVDLLRVIPISSTANQIFFLVQNQQQADHLLDLIQHAHAPSTTTITTTTIDNFQVDVNATVQMQQQMHPPGDTNRQPRQGSQYPTISNFPCYKNLKGSILWMNDMVAKAKSIPGLTVTLTDIGDSSLKTQNQTQGYDMWALMITGGSTPSVNKGVMFLMTGIHAREYAPTELVSRWAESLITAYDGNNNNKDADITAMLNHTEIHFVIQSNPDGRRIAETNRKVFRRKNLNPGPTSNTCSNTLGIGVDLNRNFPFGWGLDSGSSSDPCAPTYRGAAPASEPEVKAIINYCQSIFPPTQRKANPLSQQQDAYPSKTTVGVFVDIHSFAEAVVWPWSYQNLPTGKEGGFNDIVNKYRDFTNYEPYGPQQQGYIPASGVTSDYAYGELGTASIAIEIGNNFYQDCDYFETMILPRQLKALTYLAKISRAPFRLANGPDLTEVSTTIQGNTLIVAAKVRKSTFAAQQILREIRVFLNTHPYDLIGNETQYSLINGVVRIDASFLPKSIRHTVYLQAVNEGGVEGSVAAAYFVRPSNTLSTCVSGEMTVHVQNEGEKRIRDLKIGDMIKTSAITNMFEPIYSFGHRNPVAEVEFLQITTTSTILELSSDHMLFVDGRAIPSSMLRSGDILNDGSVVETISKVIRNGVFAPFTPSGTMLVNGIMTSCYVAFQKDSPVVKFSSFHTPVTYQWLAHSYEFPHRLRCHYFGNCHGAKYNSDGISIWMTRPLAIAHWLFSQSAVILAMVLVPTILILTFFSVSEMILTNPYYMMLGMLAIWWIHSRIYVAKQP